jgi:hypothetical protein
MHTDSNLTAPVRGCQGATAERTMTRQGSSPQPDQASHRARSREGPVFAILAMPAAERRLRVAAGCSALPLTATPRGAR